ncbi:MAG: ABC transporter ATP-binding protein [Bacteroidetes bacterium]|nr:ABC transporter ATP-binding protein [Bacteroidales bacterium]MBU1010246.1 ABC transporter ATP-binding protein [Bacteroidota bacterium]
MITVNNLSKSYSGAKVLDLPQLMIPKGQSFGLVGNNGAGKTTLFRLLLDLIRAESGTAMINGMNVAVSDQWKHITGAYLDQGFLIDFLSPEEFFEFTGNVKGMSKDDIQLFLHGMEEFFNGEVLNKKKLIRNLSMGNQQKIGVAAALMGRPELVLLDEPFNSLDPTTQIRLKNLVKKQMAEHQTTFLISSHDLNHVTEVCNRIVVLHQGRIEHDILTSADTLSELEAYFAV